MSKCVQCGKCCKKEVCKIGEMIFETTTPPCPALMPTSGNKYLCGVVLHSGIVHKEAPHIFVEALGISKGCDGFFT